MNPCIIGRDPFQTEDIWQYLYRGAYWRRGPVAMAAALHFDTAIHNFGIQDRMPHNEETDRVFPHNYTFKNGLMFPGDAPSLGVDLDEALAAKYPYQRAYLRINRKLHGTLTDW